MAENVFAIFAASRGTIGKFFQRRWTKLVPVSMSPPRKPGPSIVKSLGPCLRRDDESIRDMSFADESIRPAPVRSPRARYDRAFTRDALRTIEQDFNRSSDTHLF